MPNHNVVLPISIHDVQKTGPTRIQPPRKQLKVMNDFDNGFLRKTIDKRQCYIKKEDESLFNNVLNFYNENLLGNDYNDALSKFAKEPNGDVLVKLVYGSPFYDYIIKYSTKEQKEEKIVERNRFEKLLSDHGLYFEKDGYSLEDEVFIKILSPFQILCSEAENMKLKFELYDSELTVNRSVIDKAGKISSIITRETIDSLSSEFAWDRLENFKGGSFEKLGTATVYDNFFTSSKRILITYTILARLRLDKYRNGRSVSLKTLINDGVFNEWYPCHDGPFSNEKGRLRHVLNNTWSPIGNAFKRQPLDSIRDYFGEKIGFYFAYLGYYTVSLIVAAVAGLLVFLYGVYNYYRAASGSADVLVAISRIFDNEVTIIYTFFMSVWATIFLEYLRRQTTKIAFDWDVLEYEKEEVQRAGFRPAYVRVSPITGKWEKYQPRTIYKSKMLISFLIVFVCILIVLSSVGAMIWFRVTFGQAAGKSEKDQQMFNVLSSVLSLVIILVLGKLYYSLAVVLTNWENHRTETEYETSFITKRFLFDFVNYYSSLLYIGLVKNLLLETIPSWQDHCYIACDGTECWDSCMVDLTQQLVIIFVGKQLLNQLMEYGFPYLSGLFPYIKRELTVRLSTNSDKMDQYLEEKEKHAAELRKFESGPQYVRDDKLSQNAGLINEYNEMGIRFNDCGYS